MIQALLFDFDGLLMDTETPEVEIWQEIYAEHGAQFPLNIWLRDVVGSTISNFDVAAHLANITGKALDLTAIYERAHTLRLERQARLPAMPGVYAILASAQARGMRMAVVSSSSHAWVDGYLRQLQIASYFQFVICREDAPRLKPAPDLYLRALRDLQLPPSECLAFEDSPNGVLAARRAGLRVVGVPNPVTAHAGPLQADLVLSSLAEMPLEEILRRVAWTSGSQNATGRGALLPAGEQMTSWQAVHPGALPRTERVPTCRRQKVPFCRSIFPWRQDD